VVEDERRHQLGAPAVLEEVEGGEHHAVVVARQRGDERLERVEIELRHPGAGLDAALAQLLPEHLDVVVLDGDHADQEQEHRGGDDERQIGQRETERHGAEQRERGDRLAGARPRPVDGHLVAVAQRAGKRQVEELDAGPVQGVAQRAVHHLHHQDEDQRRTQREAERAERQQDRKHPERPAHAEPAEQPGGQE
jgi:hypothetical protein